MAAVHAAKDSPLPSQEGALHGRDCLDHHPLRGHHRLGGTRLPTQEVLNSLQPPVQCATAGDSRVALGDNNLCALVLQNSKRALLDGNLA